MTTSRLVFLVAVVAVLCLASTAMATPVITSLTGQLGTLDLTADCNWTGTVWHYTYQVTYLNSPDSVQVHLFSVENLQQLAFTNAANTGMFSNPTYNPADYAVTWLDGGMNVGQTITFSFDSTYAPDAGAYALVANGGFTASGTTIAPVVPEPASLMALMTMLGGAAVGIYRRRR